jgi:hypothetical protein
MNKGFRVHTIGTDAKDGWSNNSHINSPIDPNSSPSYPNLDLNIKGATFVTQAIIVPRTSVRLLQVVIT